VLQVQPVPQLPPWSHQQDWKVSKKRIVSGDSGMTALGRQLLGELHPKGKMQSMIEAQMRLPSGLSTRTSLALGLAG
jgi:hypothetical protein